MASCRQLGTFVPRHQEGALHILDTGFDNVRFEYVGRIPVFAKSMIAVVQKPLRHGVGAALVSNGIRPLRRGR
ncbi:hypothetical protein HFO98_23310 [Rhizobium leguminosarum]|nr:hypothetical protein [Rhizobium leguminosarum]MBY5363152.1 hypothetical protein [Rhizobium leguminosarum]MBY5411328.1 hypothetical protein [Rhizobium leguminosarum]